MAPLPHPHDEFLAFIACAQRAAMTPFHLARRTVRNGPVGHVRGGCPTAAVPPAWTSTPAAAGDATQFAACLGCG